MKKRWRRISLGSLIVLAALVLWPLVGQAPWEHNSALCQDALLRRRELIIKFPTKVSLPALVTAEQDVDEYCRQYPSISLRGLGGSAEEAATPIELPRPTLRGLDRLRELEPAR